jgi:hypothetical protein
MKEKKIMSRYLPEIEAVEKGETKAIRGREAKKYIKQKLKEERTKKEEVLKEVDKEMTGLGYVIFDKKWKRIEVKI